MNNIEEMNYLENLLVHNQIDLNKYQLLSCFKDKILSKNLKYNTLQEIFLLKKELIEMTYDFLKPMGYHDYFIEKIKDGTLFIINKNESLVGKLAKMKINDTSVVNINNKKYIFIFLDNNISDLFKISHEIMHSYNLKNRQTNTYYKLTESISFLSEFMLNDFLHHINFFSDESKKWINNRFIITKTMAKLIHLDFLFLSEFETNDLIKIIEENNVKEVLLKLYFKNIKYFKNFTFENLQNYIYAIMYASYMDCMDNKIELLKYLNDNLSNVNFRKFNKKIGLKTDRKNMQLTEEGYQLVYKAYDEKINWLNH